MLKKVSLVFIVLLISAMAILAYYLQQKKEAYIASPYGSIPLDASLIIETTDFPGFIEELTGDNYIVSEFDQIEPLSVFRDQLLKTDSLVGLKDIRGIFGSAPSLLSFHRMGRNRLEPFFAMALPPEIKEKHIREILSANPAIEYGVKEYQGYRLYETAIKGSDDKGVCLSVVKGLILISRSQILVEAGIRQSDQDGGITDMPGFTEVSDAAGRDENKLFVIFDNLDELTDIIAGSQSSLRDTDIRDLASCAEGDIFFRKDGLVFSGYTSSSDTSELLNSLLAYEPAAFESYNVIPSNVALFETLNGLSLADQSRRREYKGVTAYLADIIEDQGAGEISRLYFEINGEQEAGTTMLLYRMKGINAVEKAFREELDNYYSRLDISTSDYILKYKADEQSVYTIYLLPDNKLCAALAGRFSKSCEGRYATFFEGYLVIGESKVALSKFIYDNILNRTLANDLQYREFENTMPSRSVYYFYCVPSRIGNIMENLFNENIAEGIRKYGNSLKKVEAVGLQFSPGNDMLYTTFSITVRPDVEEKASTRWESLLDTVVYSKPMFFTNHYTGKNEIFVQDLKNNVYLVNGSGRILWKLRLAEKIVGDPVMIDYYRNNKNQILFATKNYLHLIDRNGNYVERYPVKLRAPASNGLSVFDYEKNRDYRLFICGTDNVVYLYDKSGNIVKGWKNYKTNSTVTSPVTFFRVSGKDYLIVNDIDNMYILNRRGEDRVKVKEAIAMARGSSVNLSTEANPRIILSAKDGSIKFVSFNGDVETFRTGDYGEDHIFGSFDIDSDGLLEYFFIDDGKIHAFDNKLTKMFVEKAGTGTIFGPYGFVFGANDRKLGYVDSDNNQLFLINSKGKPVKGFPLAGSTPFSIGKLAGENSYNLITGGRDSFLYNYELNR